MRAATVVGLAALAVASIGALGSAWARGKMCEEVSDVVGQQRCSVYGEPWASEFRVPVAVSIGVTQLSSGLAGRTFNVTSSKDAPTFSVDGARLQNGDELRPTGRGFDLMFSGMTSNATYIGFDIAGAFGSFQTGVVRIGDRIVSGASDGHYANARVGALLGARLPLGRLSVRGDVLLGFQILTMSLDLRDPNVGEGRARSASAAGLSGVIAPRVSVDAWVSPWMTVTAYVSGDLLGHGDRGAGLLLGWHLRAFDGVYSI